MIPGCVLAMLFFFVFISCLRKSTRNLKKHQFVPVILVTVFFTHPIVTKYFVTVFDCSKVNFGTWEEYDVERLLTNLDVDCSSEKHLQFQMYAAIGLAIWSFGVPLLFASILH